MNVTALPPAAINPGWCQWWQNSAALMSIALEQKNAMETKCKNAKTKKQTNAEQILAIVSVGRMVLLFALHLMLIAI